jgi:endoglucanase
MTTRSSKLGRTAFLMFGASLAWGCAHHEPAPPAAAATAAPGAATSPAATEPAATAAKEPEEAPPPPPAPKPLAPQPPAWKKGENPFVGVKWWSDPYAPARLKSKLLKKTSPEDSALLEKVADHGGADWIGEWTPNVENWVRKRVTLVLERNGALPLFIVYNIPKRDCGNYSAGGAEKGDAYKKWITAFANGIGPRRAVVVIEPDSLGLLTKCLSPEDQKERLALLRFAVHAFGSLGSTAVYIDAGHSGWMKPGEAAERLKEAGIEEADGFALNVSNYKTTESNIKYGKELSKLIGGKHFVIDTSRNGNGPPAACKTQQDDEACWCNPPGRALGTPPTSQTADKMVDAYLWLKKPGESDGTCSDGPKAGEFWLDKALELARNAKF